MEIKKNWDNENCWNEYYFCESNIELGYVRFDMSDNNIFIFEICSNKKGMGTYMIDYLKSLDGITNITGDIDENSTEFWRKIGAELNDDEDEFIIYIK